MEPACICGRSENTCRQDPLNCARLCNDAWQERFNEFAQSEEERCLRLMPSPAERAVLDAARAFARHDWRNIGEASPEEREAALTSQQQLMSAAHALAESRDT